jgi:hypothetical protein
MYPQTIATENRKILSHFLCGGVAASFTMITNQPVDVIRTRLGLFIFEDFLQ